MPITLEHIRRELSIIVAALAEAAESRDKGITIDLTPVTHQATELCAHIVALSPDDAMQVLPDLQNAVNQLNEIHQTVKST